MPYSEQNYASSSLLTSIKEMVIRHHVQALYLVLPHNNYKEPGTKEVLNLGNSEHVSTIILILKGVEIEKEPLGP